MVGSHMARTARNGGKLKLEHDPADPAAQRRDLRKLLAKPKPEPIPQALALALKPKGKAGRQTAYREEIGDALLAGMWRGRFATRMCRELGLDYSALSKWDVIVPGWRERFAEAQKALARVLFEQIIEIADDVSQD